MCCVQRCAITSTQRCLMLLLLLCFAFTVQSVTEKKKKRTLEQKSRIIPGGEGSSTKGRPSRWQRDRLVSKRAALTQALT